jgi:uncharacterized membrane protein
MINYLLLAHILGVVVWVGGMFFAWMILRPVAAQQLQPGQRLPLWSAVFGRFFPWVWISILAILMSGLAMLHAMAGQVPLHVWFMLGLGGLMMAIFCYVFFLPYGRLRRMVAKENWPAAGEALSDIRRLVGVNLILGLLTIAVALLGRLLV